jgi:vesicle transport through interaction with t-SNAREs protein 1
LQKGAAQGRIGVCIGEEQGDADRGRAGCKGDPIKEGDNTKSKFIRQGDLLSDTTYKLKDGVRMMHQTLEIGNNIEGDLSDHTARLTANRKKLSGVGDDLGKSGKLIKTMMGRIRRNKFVLCSVIGLIFLVVIIIMGVHFAKKKQQ